MFVQECGDSFPRNDGACAGVKDDDVFPVKKTRDEVYPAAARFAVLQTADEIGTFGRQRESDGDHGAASAIRTCRIVRSLDGVDSVRRDGAIAGMGEMVAAEVTA